MKKRKERSSKRFFLLFCFFCLSLVLVTIFKLFLEIKLRKPVFISPLPSFQKKSAPLETLKTLLYKNNITFSQVSSSDSGLIVWLTTGEEVIFTPNISFEKQISSLQLMLSRLTIEGKRFARLDFRFDKPVISFK